LNSPSVSSVSYRKPKIFYGWYLVRVGFLAHVACAFHMSSTLSVFLKPLTEDLAVSRGVFSLLRSGEILIGAVMRRRSGRLRVASAALGVVKFDDKDVAEKVMDGLS
jgi:hypothetical protein